jgi:hypothetical protein
LWNSSISTEYAAWLAFEPDQVIPLIVVKEGSTESFFQFIRDNIANFPFQIWT